MSGRVILPEEIKKQAADMKHAMENIITFLSQMKDPIRTFTEADELQGQAWTAKKNQMGGYLLIIENGISAARDMIYDCSSLSTSVGEEELREDDLITMIEQQQEIKENCQYQIMAYTELDRCAMQIPDAPRFNHGIDLAHQQIERAEKLIKLYQRKLERIDEIERATDGLFESMHHVITLMKTGLAELNNSYSGGTFHCNVNAAWRTSLEDELLMDKFDIQRPPNMKDAEWREYRKTACKEIKLLQEQGWETSSIRAYTEYINKNVAKVYTGQEAIVQLKKCNKQTQVVGSKIFRDMWYAWEIDRTDDEGARKKLNTLMTVVGMDELEDPSADPNQLEKLLTHFDKDLAPHDEFWVSLSETVQFGYPEGIMDDGTEFSETLARNVHQFRYVIDAQQVTYIRTHYEGATDEDKLAAYARYLMESRWQTADGLSGRYDWTTSESDRLHEKYTLENGQKIYPDGSTGPNYKVTFNHGFYSEFILNKDGKFLYILDESGDKNSVVNGASFNYASGNDSFLHTVQEWKREQQEKITGKEPDPEVNWSEHKRLDVNVGKYDPEFRKAANPVVDYDENKKPIKKYIAPEDTEAYKASGLKELSDQRKSEFKEKVYGK